MKLLQRAKKKQTLEGQILEYLKRKHKYGATNYELSRIALCYTKAISNLRKEGQQITTIRVSKGTFKYYWNQTADNIPEEWL